MDVILHISLKRFYFDFEQKKIVSFPTLFFQKKKNRAEGRITNPPPVLSHSLSFSL